MSWFSPYEEEFSAQFGVAPNPDDTFGWDCSLVENVEKNVKHPWNRGFPFPLQDMDLPRHMNLPHTESIPSLDLSDGKFISSSFKRCSCFTSQTESPSRRQ